MASKASNPALRAAATGLGNVVHGEAINTPDIATNLSELQTNFVAQRTRLQPELARLVAGLLFDRRAA